MNAYFIVIAASLVIIVSYFFSLIAKRTNVPSVLMLITLGILIKQGMNLAGMESQNWFPYLEVLGIVGLIMIVLEAALDLELTKEKWPILWKSFSVALFSLFISGAAVTYLLMLIINLDITSAMLYAVPLSIMSSAIVIPSVTNLKEDKREFMIYESTFSDILGIMVFYFILGGTHAESARIMWMGGFFNIFLTIIISVIASYALIFLFQNIKSDTKLFLLVAVLVLLYAVAKQFHLSSLLIILVFGLVLKNRRLFFRGRLWKYLKEKEVKDIYSNFKLITIESSFVLRTFFFVIFGITITVASIFNYKVLLISVAFLALIYGVRYLMLRLFCRSNTNPQLFLAPRGLITVLLYYAIPPEFRADAFDQGILLFVIIVSNILMAMALIRFSNGEKKKPDPDEELDSVPLGVEDKNSKNKSKKTDHEDYQG
jgi:NhaP-type Na+/H+ or K+/H+ antiporter